MKKIVANILENPIAALLSTPSYFYFAASVFLSQLAFNMLNVVLIFLIFHLTSSNFAVAILLFTVLIPQITLSFFGGVVADTVNKKKIIVIGNFARAIVLVILFFNWDSVYAAYFVTLLVSAITQFYVPAESPLIPTIVKKDKLVAANSIFGISLFGSILLGYVLAGPAISALGRSNVFLLLALLFAAAGVVATFIPQKEKNIVASADLVKKTLTSEFKSSLGLLASTRRVADAFFLLIFSQVIIFILATLIPGYAKSVLLIPAEDLSIILFAPAAIGMVIAGVGIGTVLTKVKKDKLMNLGILISGVVLILLPFMTRITSSGFSVLYFVLILAFFAGFANALIFIPSQAVIQEIIPEDFRSKIYGLLFALIGVFSLLPIIVAGGVADLVGVGAVLFTLGFAILLLGLFRNKVLIKLFSK